MAMLCNHIVHELILHELIVPATWLVCVNCWSLALYISLHLGTLVSVFVLVPPENAINLPLVNHAC
jgi:hypothetical protein